jgi:hypothetical protein
MELVLEEGSVLPAVERSTTQGRPYGTLSTSAAEGAHS